MAMVQRRPALIAGVAILFGAPSARALPVAPSTVCDAFPDLPSCASAAPACTLCHVSPPSRNAYGDALAAVLLPGAARPLDPSAFAMALPGAMDAVAGQDSDGDGVDNGAELAAGALPGDPASTPAETGCGDREGINPGYDVCGYDVRYAMKRLSLDFCGRSPTWEELQAVSTADDPQAALHGALDRCLDSEFWVGQDGQVWELGHPKIRPLQAIKAGAGRGPVPLADYDHDYALWVYTQIDGHDARDVLLADYFVDRRVTGGQTRYTPVDEIGSNATTRQNVAPEYRAGMLTTRWNLVFNTMFTALPRLTAAQAFRSYLGLDIAKLEGLEPVAGEPRDYDAKGVDAAECAVCHSTLDPLSYPFKNYQGLTGRVGAYEADRIEADFDDVAPTITAMPEAGVIMGQPVADLRGWAQVAADSEAFAANTVRDYWQMSFGEPPTPEQLPEFERLWRRLMTEHGYSVEAMLHDLIDTEAYGAP